MAKPEGGLQSAGYALGDHDGFERANDLPPEWIRASEGAVGSIRFATLA